MRTVAGLIAVLAIVASFPAAVLAQSRFFESSDGVRLHYLEAGHGPTIVFVPGWDMPGWIFQHQIDDLSHRYRVVAFDPRSQGDSDIAPSGHEPVRRGQDIAELIAVVSREPVLLAGWSLGVLDVLAYVHTHGDAMIAGLVLIDNSVGEEPPPAPSRVREPAGKRRRLDREQEMRLFVNGMFRRPQPAEFLDRLTETALRTPPDISAALLRYPVPRSYWKEAVYSTRKPVLYVVRPGLTGQADNLQANRPNTVSYIFSDAGHALFVDDAGKFDALMKAFITSRVWP